MLKSDKTCWKRTVACGTMSTVDRYVSYSQSWGYSPGTLKACHQVESLQHIQRSAGHFKNAYKLINLRALEFSTWYKSCIFQCMSKIYCVEFQRYPLKFHTKYVIHTLKDVWFVEKWRFKSFYIYKLVRAPIVAICRCPIFKRVAVTSLIIGQ